MVPMETAPSGAVSYCRIVCFRGINDNACSNEKGKFRDPVRPGRITEQYEAFHKAVKRAADDSEAAMTL